MLLVASNWVTDLQNITTIRTSNAVANITFEFQIGTLAQEPRGGDNRGEAGRGNSGGDDGKRLVLWAHKPPLLSRAWIRLVCFHLFIHWISTGFHRKQMFHSRRKRREEWGEGRRKKNISSFRAFQTFCSQWIHHYTLETM